MSQPTRFDFNEVVFFGRCLDEYVIMFDLDLTSMRGQRVLDCSGGPAAFAFEAEVFGVAVTACDPLYDQDVATLRAVVDEHAARVYAKQQAAMDLFYAEVVPTPERRKAMEIFLQDFVQGKSSGRYVPGRLPSLPFSDNQFDTALCGNLLFLYSDIASGGMLQNSPMDYEFHLQALQELLRVTKRDLRLYPLQGPNVTEHLYLKQSMDDLNDQGFVCELIPVKQRDIIGAEKMLRISKPLN
jgi:hypothetical protein